MSVTFCLRFARVFQKLRFARRREGLPRVQQGLASVALTFLFDETLIGLQLVGLAPRLRSRAFFRSNELRFPSVAELFPADGLERVAMRPLGQRVQNWSPRAARNRS